MIEIYNNRLEVSNPGGLPVGLPVKDFGKRSVQRNPLLADLLQGSRYVEKIGSGIARIQDAVKRHPLNIKLDIKHENFYVITFSKRSKNNESADHSQGVHSSKHSALKKNYRKIIKKTTAKLSV